MPRPRALAAHAIPPLAVCALVALDRLGLALAVACLQLAVAVALTLRARRPGPAPKAARAPREIASGVALVASARLAGAVRVLCPDERATLDERVEAICSRAGGGPESHLRLHESPASMRAIAEILDASAAALRAQYTVAEPV